MSFTVEPGSTVTGFVGPNGAALDAARRGRDHLRRFAHSHGLPTRRVDEVLEQVGMETGLVVPRTG